MATRDRLIEMQHLSGMENGTFQSGSDSTNKADNSLEEFLANVDAIRHVMMTLSMDREAIRREQEDSLASGAADPQKNCRLNEHVDQFIRQARGLRNRLKHAQDELKNYPQRGYGQGKARHEQIRVLQVSFESIMTKFSEDQAQYRKRANKKIAEYFRKQNIQVTDEQVDDAVENGSLFQFTKNVHLGVKERKALFSDISSRATDIMIVEKQIQEVAELFEDLHLMITQQGDTINRIETSVVNADEYVAKGNRQVREAVVLRRRSKKCKIVIVVLSILLVIVLLGVLKMFSPI